MRGNGENDHFLRIADEDVARIKALLAANEVAADEASLVELVQASRRIFETASVMGYYRVSHAAHKLVDLAQDCFPPRINFGPGANLQMRDLVSDIEIQLFEVRTGTPFPTQP